MEEKVWCIEWKIWYIQGNFYISRKQSGMSLKQNGTEWKFDCRCLSWLGWSVAGGKSQMGGRPVWVCMFIHKQNVSWNMVEVRFWSVCRRKQMGVTRSNPDSPLELPDFSWWRQNLAKSRGKTGYITFLGVQTSFSSTMHSKKISLKR